MIGLLTESYCNEIKTEGNLYKVSNIKKIIQALIENNIYSLSNVVNVDDNLSFREQKTDIISTIANNATSEKLLEKNGFYKTTIEKYNYENYNFAEEISVLNYYTKTSSFKDSININCKGIKKELSWFLQENFIVFTNTDGNASEYFYNLNDEYEMYDFKIDENNFVYFLLGKDNRTFVAKSHLGLPFLTLDKNNDSLNEDKLFFKIEVEQNSREILNIDGNEIIFGDEFFNLTKVTFGKRYYFEYDSKLFFNRGELISEFENYIIDKDIQLNNLNMYNYISLLGLNEFKINGERKISTYENDIFMKLFKNKFDNTLNGGLNFFNSLINVNNENENLYVEKHNRARDYQVDISDEYYNVTGNFVYNYKNGIFKIIINNNSCSLFSNDGEKFVFEKEIKFDSFDEFYFCNLKFDSKKVSQQDEAVEYIIEAKDGYTFMNKTINSYSVTSIPNVENVIDKVMRNSTVNGIENRKTNFDFDGKSINFYNYFDFEERKFKYSDVAINVNHNQKINLNEIKDYFFEKAYQIKNNNIYVRSSGVIHMTKASAFSFHLVNDKGYITDFWIQNQGNELYFKNTKDSVIITDSFNDCDFVVHIPEISSYVQKNDKIFDSVTVDDNDNLESESVFSNDILITDKFMGEPLFYKVYIEDENDIEIFDNKGTPVANIILEKYNNGVIAYFNAHPDKLYYYNTKETGYNYITPIKAYENLNGTNSFDDNGEVFFDESRLIKTFSLNCSKTISENEIINIILYNNKKGEVNKIEMLGSEVNTIFDLDIYVDNILIKIPEGYEAKDFSFSEINVCSIVTNDKILYSKSKRDDVVYYSKELNNVSIANLDLTKIKVYTRYTVDEKSVKESFDGNLIIAHPFANEVPIFYKDNLINIETTVDVISSIKNNDFYNSNFKSPGAFVLDDYSEMIKFTETFNDKLETKQII